jgi:predicted Ser/Thr protein kinase
VKAAELLNDITRRNVGKYKVRCLHEGRSIAQANIDLLKIKETYFALKDFYAHHPLVRTIWGRRIVAREYRVYRRLEGIPGVPRVYKKLDNYAFIMEYVPGTRIPHRKDNDLTPAFFERLKRLVSLMHKRGITHGDLRRKNILVTPDRRPYIIDLAGSFCLKGKGNIITRAVFRRLKKIDNITVLKIQNHLLPGTLNPEETKRLASVPWYLRLGRFLKKKVYRPFKHATHKRKRRK